MNVSLLQPFSTSGLTWHILLEALESGEVAAWIAEFPECKAVAKSQEAAISALKDRFDRRMASIKVLPLQLSSDDTWLKLAGMLAEDASFVEWSAHFWTEKQQAIEDDEILSIEDCLRMM